MKKILFTFFISLLFIFTSCTKYLIIGTNKWHKLDNEFNITFNENLINYNPGCIQYKYGDSIHFPPIKTSSTRIFCIYNEKNQFVINKIECLVSGKDKVKTALRLLKRHHKLYSKKQNTVRHDLQTWQCTEYKFMDKYTLNEIIASTFSDKLLILYVSHKYGDTEYNEDYSQYKQIFGADGFILGMSKQDALKNIEKLGYKIAFKTKINEAERIWFNYTGEKSKIYYYDNPFFNRSPSNFAIDIIQDDKGVDILSAYYVTKYWTKTEVDYSNHDIYENFITPLTEKYHLQNVSLEENSNDNYIYVFDDNSSKNTLTIKFNTNNNEYNLIHIKYSIDKKILENAQKILKKNQEQKNNSIIDWL